jgi:TolB-like protein/thioredoxin-like negative regulator of GroEL
VIGQALGPYRISARLGSGGMGVVWRARDERLGREVALKVLPDALVADPVARAQLMREARAASALNHPNILTVHEVGESGEHVYIVTEYVAGKPLSDWSARGALPVETVVRYGTQIADALAHAHEHGVIHRDIKASNVLVTPDGRAKLLDFGIARVAMPGGGASLAVTRTAPGVLAGTPSAMAPEQWRGAVADARSDVWSLGVLLYTQLAGKPPFDGKNAFEISAAILEQPPPPLPAHVPPALAAVVARCLAKDPLQRWRSAVEVRAALEAIGAGSGHMPAAAAAGPPRRGTPGAAIALGAIAVLALAVAALVGTGRIRLPLAAHGPAGITSLAVLPLDNFSRDPEQLYFADGITEELTTRLAQLGVLRVTSRTSVMRFRGSTESLPAIARQLGVDAVIEGSVERAGDRVRITAQLVRASTDEHLWARSYERDMKDALALQDEVAGAIVAEVQGKLAPTSPRPAPSTRAVDPAVYQAYLRGRYQYERWTTPSMLNALANYDRALAGDSTYAPAYAGRALALVFIDAGPETLALARRSLDRALALDPNLSEAHSTLAQLLFEHEWNWAAAEREFRRAIELNPNNVDARHQFSHLLLAIGRRDEAWEQARIGLKLDPLSPAMLGHMAFLEFMDGRFDAVAGWAKQALAVDATYSSGVGHAVDSDLAQRRWAQWKADEHRMAQLGDAIDPRCDSLADAFEAGRLGDARRLVAAVASPADPFPHSAVELAALYTAAGDREAAFDELEKGFQRKDYEMIYLGRDPRVADLRNDPRLLALRRRMGLPG